MGYLDELKKISSIIEKSEEFNLGQRMIAIDIFNKEIDKTNCSEDPFIAFHECVTGFELHFNYKEILPVISYNSAADEAKACLLISSNFQDLQPNSTLLSWIINALKYTDHIVLHYIQEVLNLEPERDPHSGVERSRYIQINKKEFEAQVAGNLLNNLYGYRNSLEHRTCKIPDDPKRQRIIVPNYSKVKKKILKDYPKALLSFEKAFSNHYK